MGSDDESDNDDDVVLLTPSRKPLTTADDADVVLVSCSPSSGVASANAAANAVGHMATTAAITTAGKRKERGFGANGVGVDVSSRAGHRRQEYDSPRASPTTSSASKRFDFSSKKVTESATFASKSPVQPPQSNKTTRTSRLSKTVTSQQSASTKITAKVAVDRKGKQVANTVKTTVPAVTPIATDMEIDTSQLQGAVGVGSKRSKSCVTLRSVPTALCQTLASPARADAWARAVMGGKPFAPTREFHGQRNCTTARAAAISIVMGDSSQQSGSVKGSRMECLLDFYMRWSSLSMNERHEVHTLLCTRLNSSCVACDVICDHTRAVIVAKEMGSNYNGDMFRNANATRPPPAAHTHDDWTVEILSLLPCEPPCERCTLLQLSLSISSDAAGAAGAIAADAAAGAAGAGGSVDIGGVQGDTTNQNVHCDPCDEMLPIFAERYRVINLVKQSMIDAFGETTIVEQVAYDDTLTHRSDVNGGRPTSVGHVSSSCASDVGPSRTAMTASASAAAAAKAKTKAAENTKSSTGASSENDTAKHNGDESSLDSKNAAQTTEDTAQIRHYASLARSLNQGTLPVSALATLGTVSNLSDCLEALGAQELPPSAVLNIVEALTPSTTATGKSGKGNGGTHAAGNGATPTATGSAPATASPGLTYDVAAALHKKCLLPNLQKLRQSATRALFEAAMLAAKTHTRATVECLLIPLLTSSELLEPQSEICNRLIKDALPRGSLSQLIGKLMNLELSCSAHTETKSTAPATATGGGGCLFSPAAVGILQNALNLKPVLDDVTISTLVVAIDQHTTSQAKSLKFGNLVLSLAVKYSAQAGAHKGTLTSVAQRLETAIKRAATAAVGRLT